MKTQARPRDELVRRARAALEWFREQSLGLKVIMASVAFLVLGWIGLSLSGLETTQEKSKRLQREGKQALKEEKGLQVTEESKEVKVLSRGTFQDENGIAAWVEVQNTSANPLARVPIAIEIFDRGRKSIFKNDTPGLEPGLTGVSYMKPRERMFWVHDQVAVLAAPGDAKSVKATIGEQRGLPPENPPKITLTKPKFEDDPTSGLSVRGKIKNESDVLQVKQRIYAVARKGGKVIAAGRGGVERLRPHKAVAYTIFFIGNPRGGRVSLYAPPSTLE